MKMFAALLLMMTPLAFAQDPSPGAPGSANKSPPAAALPAPAIQDASPEMLVLPRTVVARMMETMQAVVTLHQELATPSVIQIYQKMAACVNDNPTNGRLVRMGADQCEEVTRAIAAQQQKPPADEKDKKKK